MGPATIEGEQSSEGSGGWWAESRAKGKLLFLRLQKGGEGTSAESAAG